MRSTECTSSFIFFLNFSDVGHDVQLRVKNMDKLELELCVYFNNWTFS